MSATRLATARLGALAFAIAMAVASMPALAQQMDHSQHTPPDPDDAVEDPHADHEQRNGPLVSFPFKGVKKAACEPSARGLMNDLKLCLRAGTAGMGMVLPSERNATSTPSPPNPSGLRAQRYGVRSNASQWLASIRPHPLEGEGFVAPAVHHSGHAMPMPPEQTAQQRTSQQPAPQKPAERPVDHSSMGHPMPPEGATQTGEQPTMDHSSMDHGMAIPPPDQDAIDHAAMGHAPADPDLPATAPPLTPIPPITPADRAAAFPDVTGHAVHGTSIHYFALVDRLETWDADAGNALAWEGLGWVGNDLDRMWLRSEGEAVDGTLESADIEVFYGRAVARWWDAVIGIRHEFGEYPSQTFAAIGVIGVAPYKFEVEATAYLGQGGQTGAAVEAEYDTLLTNRLILQWSLEAEAWGEDDPSRGIGAGLSTAEAGLRLRYEITRRFAPYIGVVHERAYGNTADFRRADGEDIDDTRFVAGLRFWF